MTVFRSLNLQIISTFLRTVKIQQMHVHPFSRVRLDTVSERRITGRRITERRIIERRITERRITERRITERRKLPNAEYYKTSIG